MTRSHQERRDEFKHNERDDTGDYCECGEAYGDEGPCRCDECGAPSCRDCLYGGLCWDCCGELCGD